MKDGNLSDEHRAQILREAQELHISPEEVDLLIERVRLEREEQARGALPLELMREQPEIAFEQFRIAVSNLRQIAATGNEVQMQTLFETPGRATEDERAIWRQLKR